MTGITPRRGRRPSKARYEKHTISLPPDVAAAARRDMAARNVGSLSEYLAGLVAERDQAAQLDRVLDEMLAEHPLSDEDRAWAEVAFRV